MHANTWFDDLARGVARPVSRRRAVGLMLGALVGAVSIPVWPRPAWGAGCAAGETLIKGQCCPNARVCGSAGLNNRTCCPEGSKCSGALGRCCAATDEICGGALCCSPPARCCGIYCCPAARVCCGGLCCPATDTCCGTVCCPATEVCVSRQCCPAGTVCVCGGICCSGACYHSFGEILCCPAGQELCDSGTKCCPPGKKCRGGHRVCLNPPLSSGYG